MYKLIILAFIYSPITSELISKAVINLLRFRIIMIYNSESFYFVLQSFLVASNRVEIVTKNELKYNLDQYLKAFVRLITYYN